MPAAVANEETACSASCGSNAGLPSGRHSGSSTSHTRTGGRTGRGRPRPAPRRAGTAPLAKRRTPALSPSASRNASPSAMATSSTVWWVSMCRSPVASHAQVEPAVAAELVEHVVVERDAGRDVGDGRCRRGRSSTSIDVSLVARLRRRRRGSSRATSVEGGEERVVLLRRADGDAQAVGRGAATPEQSRTSTLRSSSACHTVAGRPWSAAGTARSWRRSGTTSIGSVGQRGADALALGDDQPHPGVHLVDEAQRQPAGDLLGGVEVVRQHDLVELGDEPRRARRGSRGGPPPSSTSSRTCA